MTKVNKINDFEVNLLQAARNYKGELRPNYYALYITIKKKCSVREALSYMGISEHSEDKSKKGRMEKIAV